MYFRHLILLNLYCMHYMYLEMCLNSQSCSTSIFICLNFVSPLNFAFFHTMCYFVTFQFWHCICLVCLFANLDPSWLNWTLKLLFYLCFCWHKNYYTYNRMFHGENPNFFWHQKCLGTSLWLNLYLALKHRCCDTS